MDRKQFIEQASLMLPDMEADNVQKDDIREDFGNGWKRNIHFFTNSAMIEVHIQYEPPYTTKKTRRKMFGIWCYKYTGKDWKINKPYRMW